MEGTGIVENSYSNTPEVAFIPAEEVANGALAWKANGGQFRNPLWYQTINADEIPLPLPTHGIIIYGAEQYFSVLKDADIEDVAPVIESYEEEKIADDIIATQALLDEWKTTVEALAEAKTILGFADAFDAVEAIKAAVEENKAVYKAYIDKCAEVRTILETDQTFSGNLRTVPLATHPALQRLRTARLRLPCTTT